MNTTVAPANWLASGGAYLIIFGTTLVIAIGYATMILRVSAKTRLENDGCLMAILVVLLTFAGAGLGFWVARYPMFVGTAIIGAAGLPTLATSIWLKTLTKKG